MKLNIFRRTIATITVSLAVLFGVSQAGNAQRNREDQRQGQRVEKQRQHDEKEQQRNQRQEVQREDRRIRSDQRQEHMRIRRMPNRRVGSDNNRFRVYRNGSYYQTDNRGADLLRHAVNAGYQEGYRAGRDDRNRRRSSNYNGSLVYRRGNFGYQNYVNSGQYQYYFQQGFQRGYEDGYNSRYQYGSNNNGSLNILGAILQGILNISSY